VTPQTFEEALDSVLADMRAVMIERQHKYGPHNITMFGEKGCVVRLSDKLGRLVNLHFHNGAETPDETVEDTWIDAGNYGVIALMVRRGIWGLPLSDASSWLNSSTTP
jgi:hypothetical protein